jgi:undecaprenyl pyrophosphate phosphatase UppP
MAFLASALVVKPFLHYVRRSGFAPFAWYRIALGLVAARGDRRGWM